MTDVVVRLDLAGPTDEAKLAVAIDAFTYWRCKAEPELPEDVDAPDIMVRTDWTAEALRKTLIFQDRQWAAQFLQFWRWAKRRPN